MFVQPNLSFTLAVESDQFFLGVDWAKLAFDEPKPSQSCFKNSQAFLLRECCDIAESIRDVFYNQSDAIVGVAKSSILIDIYEVNFDEVSLLGPELVAVHIS